MPFLSCTAEGTITPAAGDLKDDSRRIDYLRFVAQKIRDDWAEQGQAALPWIQIRFKNKKASIIPEPFGMDTSSLFELPQLTNAQRKKARSCFERQLSDRRMLERARNYLKQLPHGQLLVDRFNELQSDFPNLVNERTHASKLVKNVLLAMPCPDSSQFEARINFPLKAKPRAASVAPRIANNQLNLSENSPSARSQLELDFDSYMAAVNYKIKRAWFPRRGQETIRVIAEFKINRQGVLSDLHIGSSSEVATQDQAALEAIKDASPFKPLPDGAAEVIDIKAVFDYIILLPDVLEQKVGFYDISLGAPISVYYIEKRLPGQLLPGRQKTQLRCVRLY